MGNFSTHSLEKRIDLFYSYLFLLESILHLFLPLIGFVLQGDLPRVIHYSR